MSKWYRYLGWCAYGREEAYFEVIAGRLVLQAEDPGEALQGFGLYSELEGLTPEQALQKVQEWNACPVGHSYDGCARCTTNRELKPIEKSEVPAWARPKQEHADWIALLIRETLREAREKGVIPYPSFKEDE